MIILLLLLHRVRSFPDLFYFYFIDSSFSAALLCSVSAVICSRYRIVISGLIRWNSQDFDPAKKKEACWYWFFRLILSFVVDREWFFFFLQNYWILKSNIKTNLLCCKYFCRQNIKVWSANYIDGKNTYLSQSLSTYTKSENVSPNPLIFLYNFVLRSYFGNKLL